MHRRPVEGLAWNLSGTQLASAGRDGLVRVWSINVRAESLQSASFLGECMELKGHSNEVPRVSWNPTAAGAHLLASCSIDRSVRVWDTRSGVCLANLSTLGENLHLKWSPCGRWLLLLNGSNLVSLLSFDVQTSKLAVLKSVGFSQDVNDIEWSRDSSRVMLGHQNGSLEILSIPALTKLHSVGAHGGTIFVLTSDAKGKYIATGAGDSLVHLWHPLDLVCARTFSRQDDSIRTLSFNHDGSLLAIGGKDARIEIADVETGSRVAVVETNDETLAVAFHPSAQLLAYSTGDKATASMPLSGGGGGGVVPAGRPGSSSGDIHIISIAHSSSAPSTNNTTSSGSVKAASGSSSGAASGASTARQQTVPQSGSSGGASSANTPRVGSSRPSSHTTSGSAYSAGKVKTEATPMQL